MEPKDPKYRYIYIYAIYIESRLYAILQPNSVLQQLYIYNSSYDINIPHTFMTCTEYPSGPCRYSGQESGLQSFSCPRKNDAVGNHAVQGGQQA